MPENKALRILLLVLLLIAGALGVGALVTRLSHS